MLPLDGPPLTPDGSTARQWVKRELAKPEYHEHEPWTKRLERWLIEHLSGHVGGVTIPWQLVLGVLVLGIAVVALLSWRRFAPTRRVTREVPEPSAAVFGAEAASTTDYRAEAEALLTVNPAAALVAAYRALVRRAGDLGFLALEPSTTVADVDAALTRSVPGLSQRVLAAGAAFAHVRYGSHTPPSSTVRDVLDLDDALTARTNDAFPQGDR